MAIVKKLKKANSEEKPLKEKKSVFVGGAREVKKPAKKNVVEGVVIPDTAAECADLLYKMREERLAIERKAARVGKVESVLKEKLTNMLPKDNATGVRGHVAQVTIDRPLKATVRDWDKVFAYVNKHKAYDLLRHQINDSAVIARWENGEKVPGVEKFYATSIHCTKIGKK
jgi:tRNA-binding EMAP/Myf-like protein